MPFTPVLLTDEQLQELCNYLSETSYIYYPIATSFFMDLYKTGCRPMELLTMSRWNYIGPTQIELTPEKGNNIRTFTEADLSEDLLFSIINQVRPYEALSLRQLTSVLKKILPVIQVTTDVKSAIDYMFRYNKVKTLHNAGQTDLQIATTFGWSTPLLSASYYGMAIFSIPELPPTFLNSIIDNSGNYLIDDAGNFITYP